MVSRELGPWLAAAGAVFLSGSFVYLMLTMPVSSSQAYPPGATPTPPAYPPPGTPTPTVAPPTPAFAIGQYTDLYCHYATTPTWTGEAYRVYGLITPSPTPSPVPGFTPVPTTIYHHCPPEPPLPTATPLPSPTPTPSPTATPLPPGGCLDAAQPCPTPSGG